ncbi:hypothetical protein BGZ63DRAFT_419808 [Mariannaea sp. PMI_226]|nr:hypothetical protein BGZ63DRAFT_419808 [Mariannaea sp. PMI_226]
MRSFSALLHLSIFWAFVGALPRRDSPFRRRELTTDERASSPELLVLVQRRHHGHQTPFVTPVTPVQTPTSEFTPDPTIPATLESPSTIASTLLSTTVSTSATLPLPSGWSPLDSGKRVGKNFPPTFRLTDGHQTVKEILYRMRDQVCMGTCGKVRGDSIPNELLASQIINAGDPQPGCEIAAKLSAGKEIYFHASKSGAHCYEITEQIIEQKFTDSNDGANRFFDSGYYQIPDNDELYSLGIRDLNAQGSSHPDLTTDTTKHLGHRQIACRSNYHVLWMGYDIFVSEWDDGSNGRSVFDNVKSCNVGPSQWGYVSDSAYKFEDGTNSEYHGSWRNILQTPGCVEAHIAHAIGLLGEGLHCGSKYTQLDMFA